MKQRMMEVVVTFGAIRSCKAPVKSSSSTNQHPGFFLQAGCPSCQPTNSVKALKGMTEQNYYIQTAIKNVSRSCTTRQGRRNTGTVHTKSNIQHVTLRVKGCLVLQHKTLNNT